MSELFLLVGIVVAAVDPSVLAPPSRPWTDRLATLVLRNEDVRIGVKEGGKKMSDCRNHSKLIHTARITLLN